MRQAIGSFLERVSRSPAVRRFARPLLLILPSLAILLLLFLSPAFYNVLLSLQHISLFQLKKGGTFVGIDNYVHLVKSSDFWLGLWNTLFWLTLVTVVIRLFLGLFLALLVDAPVLKRWKLSGVARSALLIPWVTPPVVAVAAWEWLLQPRYGAINQILVGLHIVRQGIPFFDQISTVWIGIVVIIVWREVPFVAISVLAGLQGIPEELYESARVEGASNLQVFLRITLPLLRPVFVIVTLLTVIWTFNNFLYVWLSTGGGPGNFTDVLATEMYRQSFVNYRMGYGASIGIVMVLLMLLFAVGYFRTVFKWNVEED